MATDREVDRLLWAVAEARRLRRLEEEHDQRTHVLPVEEFVTEWYAEEELGVRP